MWVKICGNTDLGDCLLAAELGADALGFIFSHGKRLVTAAHVAAIVPQLPTRVEKIGVFTTRDYDSIVRTVEEAGLTGVQLHGPLDFALSERLRAYFGEAPGRCSVIQVLPWYTDQTAAAQQDAFAAEARELAEDASADALLIDSRTREASGGTGKTFDWAAAHHALRGVDYRTVVAGGLHAGNVAAAIHTLQPWGVDVSSGVESIPGRKDAVKLAAFVAAAREVTAGRAAAEVTA